jgi:phosphoribosyl-ATP pyrophosphohydrolase/phosphoribosyl-AMP cyclohydrolase/histidinol dehydrogenase
MTACTARAAGVKHVYVASPRPAHITKAAAYVAGADALICVGGAQAIGAFAFGAGSVPAVDVIVGPGNKFVTAAKQLVSGIVGIDMLAGPSELLVVADAHADPITIAADMLAQAEHDTEAVPVLIAIGDDATAESIIDKVQGELARQLSTLPTADTARAAVERNGFAVKAANLDEAVQLANHIASEHLELLIQVRICVLVSTHQSCVCHSFAGYRCFRMHRQ